LSEARTAILHIARLHAYWWGNPKLDKFDWLAASPRIPNEHELQHFREHMWPGFLGKIDKPLPDEMMAIGTFLGKNLDRIERHLFGKSQTLIHSDYHPGNLMFGTGQDRPFSIVDWQFVKRGRGIWDVGYFMLQSLSPDDRRAAEMDLVRYYLELLNHSGVQGYAFEDALFDYRLSLLRRFGNLITTIAAMPFAKAQIRMHIEVLLPRAVSAILDNDCRSLLSRAW
jgi:thiamine kinase-like enzyme